MSDSKAKAFDFPVFIRCERVHRFVGVDSFDLEFHTERAIIEATVESRKSAGNVTILDWISNKLVASLVHMQVGEEVETDMVVCVKKGHRLI